MDLHNTFVVARPVEETWPLLLDVERIAPCLPGARLDEIVEGEHRGVVKVRIGPVSAEYKGAATFLDRDDAQHRVVIRGRGRDSRGAGSAEALITARLEAVDEATTRVSVDTELQVKGKVAQFGRGMMAEVSSNLMDQFAGNLAALLAAEQPPAPAERPPPPPPAAESADLLASAAGPILKRLAPIAGLLVVVLIVRTRCRRDRTAKRTTKTRTRRET